MAQHKQAEHYNQKAKTLVALNSGDSVYMRLPGSTTWSPGICIKQVAPRSYLVDCKGNTYRHNRRHLRKAKTERLVYKPAVDYSDSESEMGEEVDDDIEHDTEPTNDSPCPNNPQTVSQQTSSFGRVIRPPKRYAELENM